MGIIAVSGTGSVVVGVDERGRRARAGGWGYHLDRGGGYAIARGTLAAITLAQDGLGPVTTLTERILKRLGLSDPRGLVEWLYAPDRRTEEIAVLAEETVSTSGGSLSRCSYQAACSNTLLCCKTCSWLRCVPSCRTQWWSQRCTTPPLAQP